MKRSKPSFGASLVPAPNAPTLAKDEALKGLESIPRWELDAAAFAAISYANYRAFSRPIPGLYLDIIHPKPEPELEIGYLRRKEGARTVHELYRYGPPKDGGRDWELVASVTSFEAAIAAARLFSGVAGQR